MVRRDRAVFGAPNSIPAPGTDFHALLIRTVPRTKSMSAGINAAASENLHPDATKNSTNGL